MKEITILDGLLTTTEGVMEAVLPLLAILLAFQVLFLRLPSSYILNLLKGTLIASVGLVLFLQGVKEGFLPYGQAIGEALGDFSHKWMIIPFGFILGFLTTLGEPAVRILCDQVEETSSGSIRKPAVLYAICIGVAMFVALGMARIVYSIPLLNILIPGYALVMVLLWFSQKDYTSIAIDAGGVATGPMANTFLLGLGLGLSAAIGSQDAIIYGLGLVALIALAPIISVMTLGLIMRVRIYYRR